MKVMKAMPIRPTVMKVMPAALKGLGITFITVGLMGIAFMTFMGVTL